MATDTKATTTRPRRSAAKREEAPKTISKPEGIEEASATNGDDVDRLRLSLEHTKSTTRYERFDVPAESGCIGALYVPKGAKSVKILIER